MTRDASARTSVIAAVMVGLGALVTGLLSFLMLLNGQSLFPRLFLLSDPIGFALRPGAQPLGVAAMLLALIVLAGLTWLFVRLIVRSALPGRAAAVFFGTWGAIVVAAWAAGILRAPLMVAVLQIPADQGDILQSQIFQISTAGVYWALLWGWLTALVAALVHRAAARAPQPPAAATAPPQPYAQPQAYPPAPPYSQGSQPQPPAGA